jgi:hypothetical protein
MLPAMELITGSADEVPMLYRSILALIEELERVDRRAEAARIRASAQAAYATAWDARQRQRLQQLELRLRRSISEARPSARSRRFRLT